MWVKLDDGFADHPKVIQLNPLAVTMQVRALCYASRHLTDGFIPAGAVPQLLAGFERVIMRDTPDDGRSARDVDWAGLMVEAGLWDRVEHGYLVHDFLDYNPSKSDVLKERKKTRDRITKLRRNGRVKSPQNVTVVQREYYGECTENVRA